MLVRSKCQGNAKTERGNINDNAKADRDSDHGGNASCFSYLKQGAVF
jgi:hypothetical protein